MRDRKSKDFEEDEEDKGAIEKRREEVQRESERGLAIREEGSESNPKREKRCNGRVLILINITCPYFQDL